MFVEIVPRKNKSNGEIKEKVRISFSNAKVKEKNTEARCLLSVYIGDNISTKLGIKDKEKISFYYKKENPRICLIKKSLNNLGYTLTKLEGCLRTQLTWDRNIFDPSRDFLGIRDVEYNLYDGGVRIFIR